MLKIIKAKIATGDFRQIFYLPLSAEVLNETIIDSQTFLGIEKCSCDEKLPAITFEFRGENQRKGGAGKNSKYAPDLIISFADKRSVLSLSVKLKEVLKLVTDMEAVKKLEAKKSICANPNLKIK